MNKIIYSIQGNIGSGKSTLLKAVTSTINNVIIVPQPIQDWQQVAGFNLLDKYYEDPVRWGFTFQSNCILSRMTQLSNLMLKMQNNNIYISQRSVQADKYIFARLMHKLNKMNDLQYNLYLQMFSSLQNLFNRHAFNINKIQQNDSTKCQQNINITNKQQPPTSSAMTHKYIYLQTSPQKCYQRIKKRNRSEEKTIQFDYIKEIHNLHQDWLLNNTDRNIKKQEILVINGQKQFQNQQKYLKQILNKINNFVYQERLI